MLCARSVALQHAARAGGAALAEGRVVRLLRSSEAALVAGRRRRLRQVRVQLGHHLAVQLHEHLQHGRRTGHKLKAVKSGGVTRSVQLGPGKHMRNTGNARRWMSLVLTANENVRETLLRYNIGYHSTQSEI